MVYNNLYSFSDLLTIFPFGKTKLRQLLHAGVLPVVKVGRQYVTSDDAIQRWIREGNLILAFFHNMLTVRKRTIPCEPSFL
mgnify:CR=1 FL=1